MGGKVIYFFSIYEGHTHEEVRVIAFSSLVIGNIFLILTNLSKTRNIFNVVTEKNWALWIILSIAVIVLFLIIAVPFLQQIFSFKYPGLKHFIPSIVGALFIITVLETVKFIRNKKRLTLN